MLTKATRVATNTGGLLAINWAHPSTRQLLAVIVAGPGGVIQELVHARIATTAPAYKGVSPLGVVSADWTLAAGDTNELNWTTGPFTAMAHYYCFATAGGFPAIFGRFNYVSESDNQGWLLGPDGGGNLRWMVFSNNSSSSYNVQAGTLATGLHSIAGNSDSSGRNIFGDGVRLGGTPSTNLTPASNTVGGLSNNTGGSSYNGILIGYAWARNLDETEIAYMHKDPFAFVYEPTLLNYAVLAGPGTPPPQPRSYIAAVVG